jgi:hypothetical protein
MANQTHRFYFADPFNGRHRQNIQIQGVNTTSVAIVTAAEYSVELVPANHPNERRRKLGDANVWVSNVSVHGDDGTSTNGVEFIINVDFPHPLFIVVDVTILDVIAQVRHL